MVNSIDPIDSLQAVQQIQPLETTEQAAQTAAPPEAQPTETDSFQTSQSAFADYQIKDYVTTYVNNLVAKFDGYDDIVSRLLSYLGTFDINTFKQNYPDIASNADLATALYNETQKFL